MYAREVVGFVIVLLSAICYGSITTFATIAYRSGLLVEHLVISRGIVVSILCCAIAIAFRQPMEVGKFRLFPVFFISATLVATSFCQLGAVQYISVGLTVILFFTFPILVLIFNAIFDSEAVSIRLIVLSIISLSGIAISIGTEIDTVDVRGVILALIAAVAMASSIILAQRQLSKNSILGLAFVSNFTASVLALLLWSLIGQSHFPNLPDETRILGITMMLAVGILFAAGLLLQLKGIRCIGSNSTSIALNFEPIVTLIIATVFIGEILTWNKIIGAILVVTAVVLSTLSDQPAPEPEP